MTLAKTIANALQLECADAQRVEKIVADVIRKEVSSGVLCGLHKKWLDKSNEIDVFIDDICDVSIKYELESCALDLQDAVKEMLGE